MPRPRSTEGGRPHVVTTRFSQAEVEDMDSRKGPLSRSEWIRFLNARAKRDNIRFGGLDDTP